MTSEAVAEMIASAVPEPRLRRLLGNQWVSGEDAFITPDAWDQCGGDPEINEGDPVVIGVDADPPRLHERRRRQAGRQQRLSCALAGVATRQAKRSPTRRRRALCCRSGRTLHGRGGRFDPRYFVQAAQNLADKGVETIEWVHRRMPERGEHVAREIVANGRLCHGGDPVARQHALAAETVEREYGEMIKKKKTREPNDALVRLAMACEWAASLKPKRESVLERRFTGSRRMSWWRDIREWAAAAAIGRGRRAAPERL